MTTFHAGNCGDAMNRLVEMGIPAYAVRNAVRLVVAQRLVRRLCSCARDGDVEQDARQFGMDVSCCRIPGACEACNATGYRGRVLVAEWQAMDDVDASFRPAGDDQLWASAEALVEAGLTSPMEVIRVLGFRRSATQ
jgi:type II secretory ATPase GspE/PulE/Tfp pilus assembly ATPase PilB-like protein